MGQKHFTEEQIAFALRQAESRPSATFTSDLPCYSPSSTPLNYTCERLNSRAGKSKSDIQFEHTDLSQ